MSATDGLYDFVYRAMLTEEALDSAGRNRRSVDAAQSQAIAEALSLELLEVEDLEGARQMAIVYTAIAAFESSARRFVTRVLMDAFGEEWWEKGVSEKIRKFAESRRDEEEKTKWHGVRGDSLLDYTELGHIPNILQQNWDLFEPYVRRIDWATSLFATLERSRNVIMHSGSLALPDVERVGMSMRDWNKQVGL
ncbi:MAG: Swt1 family HEPN domain-containing protein [Propionicimonas sp.]|uniref:Swt1 family HEPN domain-containing protein n=1 Tax=Propionicimonas sp. TaxID=1955623 RepID=UPI003D0DF905